MKILFFLFFVTMAFLCGILIIHDKDEVSSKTEWICWYVAKDDPSKIVYGSSVKRHRARNAAKKLCERHFRTECKFEYCERIKR